MIPATRHVVISRDVVFNESESWSWKDEEEGPTAMELTISYDDSEHIIDGYVPAHSAPLLHML
jgi:hypothetical protein